MADGRTTFAIDVRVLQCGNCSAPLAAPVAGGQVTCEYCGAVTRVAPRPDLHVATPVAPPQPGVDEGQRLFALHQQSVSYDAKASPYSYYLPPDDLTYLTDLVNNEKDGYRSEALLAKANHAWTAALAGCRAAPQDPRAQRRCYWLVMLMSQIWSARREYMRQRAALESAGELMVDPGHRYVIGASLAAAARNMGDLDAAEAWLATLDPRPWHLDLDSAYRTVAAAVALSRGQPDRALATVGRSAAEVPFEPSRRNLSQVLRAAAYEGLGDAASAEATLVAAAQTGGRALIERILSNNTAVGAAKVAWDRLEARGAIPKGRGARGGKGRSPVSVLLRIAGPFVLLPLGILFSPLIGQGIGSAMGYQGEVMRRLETCPAAVAVLGDDVRPAVVGWSCGNAESSGAMGHASWTLPVRGSRGSGTYQFAVDRHGGPWNVLAATLTANGQTIDVGSCAAPPVVPTMPAMPAPGLGGPAVAPTPGVPAPTPGPGAALAGGACDRLAACCAVAGSNPHVGGLCSTLPQVRSTPVAEQVCGQQLGAARQVLQATTGSVPPDCQ